MAIELSDITSGVGGFVINGEHRRDFSGGSIAGAGDVNGDGLADLIIGAGGTFNYGGYAGRSYVVFGQSGTTAINLSAVAAGSGGFVIYGENNWDFSGGSVSAAGDINGDGLADLIIGASSSDFNGFNSGRSYVVFGRRETTAINLSAVATGSGGFAINGERAEDASGNVVAAGDVNGDGLADLIIGAPRSDINGSDSGRSYVVFGRSGQAAINLSEVAEGIGGFAINGENNWDFSGCSVDAAGDVNGDGLADLIVGAHGSSANGVESGRSYVVFGQRGTTAINLSVVAVGNGGFVINGESVGNSSGQSVAAAGDVNGDGLADLIVGAANSDANGGRSGRCYVVFGQKGTTAINLSAIAAGNGGFAITGENAMDFCGNVAAAGDVNGDGLADLIVGAGGSDVNGYNSGRSYVVFGQSGTAAINLSSVAAGSGGFAINGERADDGSCNVSAAGDVNGDGLADLFVGAPSSDLVVGAPGNNLAGYFAAGRSYIIFGNTTGAFSQTAVNQMGGTGNDTLTGSADSETIVAGAGNDILIGDGGADVLYGGSGNDRFELNADNIAKLRAGITEGNFARIDGGSGIDTLAVSGSDVTLDLTTIANQGGAAPSSASRIESVERIDLTGIGNNNLTLSVADVIDMADMNNFNDGSGWMGLGASVARHQLVVDGNAGDSITFADPANWTVVGVASFNGNHYCIYNHNNAAAQVLFSNTNPEVTPGTAGNDTLAGDVSVVGSNDLIAGLAGDDYLSGLAGNDTLDGGTGKDTLIGGVGNDTYLIDTLADVISEGAGEGTDQANVALAVAGTYT